MATVRTERVPTRESEENAVGGRLKVREAARLLQLGERQVQRSSGAIVPTASIGCITATADGPCLGLCPWPCGAPSSNWPAASIEASTILISVRNFTAKSICPSAARACAPFCPAKLASPQKAPRPPVPRSPLAPSPPRHDGAHRRQPS
jgi:hypothetical protein